MAQRTGLLLWRVVLLFLYNIIVGYNAVAYTTGLYKVPFLLLIFLDFAIIFYFATAATKSAAAYRAKRGKPRGVRYENGVAFLAIVYNIVIGMVTVKIVFEPIVVLVFLFVDFFLIAYYVFFLRREHHKIGR